MKFVPAVIGIAVAAAAGYLLEPVLRPALIPTKPEPVVAMPDWVSDLTPGQLPAKVSLTRKALIAHPDSPQPIDLAVGFKVRPVRVEEDQLVVSPFGGPAEAKVPVMHTDLVERLGGEPPPPAGESLAMNEAEPEPTPEPAPTPTPEPEPEVTAIEEPEEEMVAVEPEPEPEPDPAEPLGPEQIVEAMQAHIKEGGIKEFTFDQVLSWEPGSETDRDGETYQTGDVSYKAETIFGVKNIQAQALIKDGKVVRWIWPKSGMEIQ